MSLHKQYSQWDTDPLAMFMQFVVSEDYHKTSLHARKTVSLSDESIRIYRSMFSRFVEYLKAHQLTMSTVQSQHIYAFLTRRVSLEARDGSSKNGVSVPELESDIQSFYLRLLERVFTHIERFPRPTDDMLFGPMKDHYRLNGRNQKTAALSDAEIDRYLQHLPTPTAQERSNRPSAAWKKRRDRAMHCMMLGAGLTVAEAIALRISEVAKTCELDGRLRIDLNAEDPTFKKHPTFYEHTTFLQARFVPEVLAWIEERSSLPFTADLMFPSHQGHMLNKATVYLQVQKVFQRADIAVARQGGRTLRNTFAATEIRTGTSAEELQAKLGLYEERGLRKYLEAAQRKK